MNQENNFVVDNNFDYGITEYRRSKSDKKVRLIKFLKELKDYREAGYTFTTFGWVKDTRTVSRFF